MIQRGPLPAALIPYGHVGPWTPPKMYGVMTSPPIELTAADWPEGAPQTAAAPQFATGVGQQIGSRFFFFGTALASPGGGFEGYLGDPADCGNWPHDTFGTPGPIVFVNTEIMDPGNWQGIEGQPVVAVRPPKL